MKKIAILFSLAMVLFCSQGMTYMEQVKMNSSSYTSTVDSISWIRTSFPGDIFVGIVVGSTASGSIAIYDSSKTTTVGVATQIAKVDMGTRATYEYNIVLSSGLSYVTSTSNNGVTILYKKMR